MKFEIIGSFNLMNDDTFFEHYVGKNVTFSKYKVFIEIYGDEGKNIPHFHVYTKDHEIDAPIRLYTCGYFLHGVHSSPLPKGGADALNNWFKKPSMKNPDITNWEYADKTWTELYDNSKRFTETQPDYSKLDIPLEGSSRHVNIDLQITNRNMFKINNDFIKLGFDNDGSIPTIVIMGSVKDNSRSVPCILKYTYYHKDIGTAINVCIHKNNTIKYNDNEIERLVKNVVSSELFKINNDAGKYVLLDFFKISNKVGNKQRR